MKIFWGILAYAVAGGLWMAFRYFAAQYETKRDSPSFLLEVLMGVGMTGDLSILFTTVEHPLFADAHILVLVVLWALSAALFVGAVVVELKNQPQNYTIRKRNIKYGLQYMSGGTILLFILGNAHPIVYSIDKSLYGTFIQVFPTLFLAVLLVCSSTMQWRGVRYIVWAIKNSGNLKPASKAMKNLRRSPRR